MIYKKSVRFSEAIYEPSAGICGFWFKVWGQDFDSKGLNFALYGVPNIATGLYLRARASQSLLA